MTTELEKQFFNTFGIKSEMGCTAYEELGEAKADLICNDYCPECDYFKEVYPQITDKQYLELIRLYVSTNDYFKCFADTEKISFRNQILEKYIANKRFFDKHQVQAIFKESEQE